MFYPPLTKETTWNNATCQRLRLEIVTHQEFKFKPVMHKFTLHWNANLRNHYKYECWPQALLLVSIVV